MKLQQYLLNDYLHVEYEDFSHKASAALGILITIKHSPLYEGTKEQKDLLDEKIKEVREIIETTDKDTRVSLFVLDRHIIPQDMSKTVTIYSTKFERLRIVKGERFLTLTQDQIQNRLCNATLRIHEILMEQISGFSDQMFMDSGDL